MKMHFLMGLLFSFAALADPAVQSSSGAYPAAKRTDAPAKTSRLEGRVLSTNALAGDDRDAGIRMRLDVGNSAVDVQLGPRWFLSQHDLNLTQGQPITVIGLALRVDGGTAFVAHELQQGSRRVPLRTPAGEPLWKKEMPSARPKPEK